MRCFAVILVALLGCAPLPSDGAPAPDDAAVVRDGAVDGLAPLAVDAATPESFARVEAIFRRSCGGYCHAGGVDIGASLVFAAEGGARPRRLDLASRQVPRMLIVAPGDPDASYLMRKITGTMRDLPECAADARRCGIPMPYAFRNDMPAVVMSVEDREAIRRWIAEGAPGLSP